MAQRPDHLFGRTGGFPGRTVRRGPFGSHCRRSRRGPETGYFLEALADGKHSSVALGGRKNSLREPHVGSTPPKPQGLEVPSP